jgi:hypothetical protein
MRVNWGHRAATVVLVAGCATLFPPTPDELKHSAERFGRQVQWSDLRGAALNFTPMARAIFVAETTKRDDEKNLKVTDVELEDMVIAKDGKSAVVTTKLTWYRMPDLSTKTERMVMHWEVRDNFWVLTQIDGGPVAVNSPAKAP